MTDPFCCVQRSRDSECFLNMQNNPQKFPCPWGCRLLEHMVLMGPQESDHKQNLDQFSCFLHSTTLRQPHSGISPSTSDSPTTSPITSSSSFSPICSSITPSLFHSRLKTYLPVSHKSYPRSFTSSSQTGLHSRTLACTVSSEQIVFFSLSLFFLSLPCARLSWPFCQLLSARKYIISYIHVTNTDRHIDHATCDTCSNKPHLMH